MLQVLGTIIKDIGYDNIINKQINPLIKHSYLNIIYFL